MSQSPPTHDSRLTTDDEALAAAPISSSRRIHLPALDGMRGAGVLGVMIMHFSHHDPGLGALGRSAVLLQLSAWGMPMFFLLSGFLITGILLEAREKPRYFRNFFARRSLRIFPLYYGVLFLLFVVHPAWGHAIGGTSSPRWLWLYASNIEMARKDGWTYDFVSHFWSLAVEEQYYIFWPFIVLAFKPRRLLFVCAVLGAFSVALRITMTTGWSHLAGAYILMPAQLDPLAMGGVLAVLVRRRPPESYRNLARGAVLASLAVLLSLGWYKMPMMSRPLIVGRPLLSCSLFGGILLLAIGDSGLCRRILGAGVFTFLGKYSYGLYVYHYLLVPVLGRVFDRRAIARSLGSPFAALVAGVLLSILVSLAIAIASYELYEKRFLRLKSRFAGA